MSLGYLLASLPMLFPDRAPAIGTEAFVEACAAALGPREAEAAALLATGGDAPSAHPAVKAWRALEAAVAVAIGRKRLARRGGAEAATAAPETSACPVWLVRQVEAAFESAPDPLAREEALLRVLWAAADDFGGFDPMAKRQVFAYAVKLRLALRRAAWDQALGAQRLEAALPKAVSSER